MNREKVKPLERVKLIRDYAKIEGDMWKKRFTSLFYGCDMIGRKLCGNGNDYIYFYDIGSRFNLVGVLHPDGATMIMSDRVMRLGKFEEGSFRIPLIKRPKDKEITRVKLNKKTDLKREVLHGRKEKKKEIKRVRLERKIQAGVERPYRGICKELFS